MLKLSEGTDHGRGPPVLTRGERVVGAALVVLAIGISATLMGVATVLLDVAMVAAYAIWVSGRWRLADATTVALYLVGIVVQVIHSGEEYLTGFQREFPALFGYEWSDRRFVSFNVAWLVVFIIAAVALRRGKHLAYLAVFFFAIGGGIANGVGHLLL